MNQKQNLWRAPHQHQTQMSLRLNNIAQSPHVHLWPSITFDEEKPPNIAQELCLTISNRTQSQRKPQLTMSKSKTKWMQRSFVYECNNIEENPYSCQKFISSSKRTYHKHLVSTICHQNLWKKSTSLSSDTNPSIVKMNQIRNSSRSNQRRSVRKTKPECRTENCNSNAMKTELQSQEQTKP